MHTDTPHTAPATRNVIDPSNLAVPFKSVIFRRGKAAAQPARRP